MNAFDRLREQLIKDGWKEQHCGPTYINGTDGSNFYKENEGILHIGFSDMDDEEFEELFGEQ